MEHKELIEVEIPKFTTMYVAFIKDNGFWYSYSSYSTPEEAGKYEKLAHPNADEVKIFKAELPI